MTGTLKKITDAAEDISSKDMAHQLESLRNELSGLTKKMSELGHAAGEDALSAVKTKATDARDAVVDQSETARLHAMELQDKAESFVKNQPVAAISIAAGLGILIGIAASRR